MRAKNFLFVLIISAVLIAGGLLLQSAFIDIYQSMFGKIDTTNLDEMTTIADPGEYSMAIIFMCVIFPLIEELIFRLALFLGVKLLFDKIILKRPSKWTNAGAIIFSALAFAIYHQSMAQFLYQFLMGVAYATIFLRTGNFFYNFFLHFINNFFVVTYLFIAGGDDDVLAWNAYTIVTTIVLASLATCIIISLIQNLQKEHHGRKQTT